MNEVIITAYKGSSKITKIIKQDDILHINGVHTNDVVGYISGYCQCLIDNGYEVVID